MAYFTKNKPHGSCLRVFASDGTKVSQLGVFEAHTRFYVGYGCGDHKHAPDIEQAATSVSGAPETYLERGDGVCVGPFRATKRTGSL